MYYFKTKHEVIAQNFDQSGWIYLIHVNNMIKVGLTGKKIINRLNQYNNPQDIYIIQVNQFIKIERLILGYIKQCTKIKPLNGREYFDMYHFNDIMKVVKYITSLKNNHIDELYELYDNKRDKNKYKKVMNYFTKFNLDIEYIQNNEYEDTEIEDNDNYYDEDEQDNEEQVINNKETKMNKCELCGKTYNKYFSMPRHYKICEKTKEFFNILKPVFGINDLTEEIHQVTTEYNKLKNENHELLQTNKKLIEENMLLKEKEKEKVKVKNPENKIKNIAYDDVKMLEPFTYEYIQNALIDINITNTINPYKTISNEVSKTSINLNYYVKDKARNIIVFKDENGNLCSDTRIFGKLIQQSIIEKVQQEKNTTAIKNKKTISLLNEIIEGKDECFEKIIKYCTVYALSLKDLQVKLSNKK